MITGQIQYVVLQVDDEDTVIAVWGPFPNGEEANNWEGIPGNVGVYRATELRSAPQWFVGATPVDEEV